MQDLLSACSLSRPFLECIRVISCNRFESVNDAIAWYLSETSLSTIDSVCLAIAGPTKGACVPADE